VAVRTPDNAVFRHDSFTSDEWLSRAFTPLGTPRAFQLEGPPDSLEALAFPVTRVAACEFSILTSCVLAAACDVESTAQARTASARACLGLTAIAIQNAFDWLDPNISVGMGRQMINVMPTFCTTWTPFRMV
jgi:hypothetical protein